MLEAEVHCHQCRKWRFKSRGRGAYMNTLTIQMQLAPTRKPWRVQMDCGMISPARQQDLRDVTSALGML